MQWHVQGLNGTCRAFGSSRVTRMVGAMPPRRWLPAMALLVCSVIRVDASPCPGPASVAMFAENLSADSAVTLHVERQLTDTAKAAIAMARPGA
jgi:hypothetical protein